MGLALMVASGAMAGDVRPGREWLSSLWRWGYHDIGPEYFMTPGSAQVVASNMHKAGAEGMIIRIASEGGPSWKTKTEGRTDFFKDRDIVDEVGAACHHEHLKFVGYIYALVDKPLLALHPEWAMLNAAGQPVGALCCNTGYRELMKKRLVELAQNYPDLNGVMFDMFMWWPGCCYCPDCKAKFKALTGFDAPVNQNFADPVWRAWADFQHHSIEDSMKEWRDALRAVRPDFVLMANTWSGWIITPSGAGASSVGVDDYLDGTLEETGWYWGAGGEGFFGWPVRWPYMSQMLRCVGDNAALRGPQDPGAGPGRCVATMWEAGNIPPYVNGPLPASEVVARAAVNITFGVHPMPYFRRGPEGMKPIYDFLAPREKWLNGARAVPWCGVVVSEKTQYWYGKDKPLQRYQWGVYGIMRTLFEQHVPFEIITDEDVERRDLSPYAVILMDNTACLSDAAAERLREYVKKGGGLVATGETSLYDEGGKKQADFGLGDLFGAKALADAVPQGYVGIVGKQDVLSAATVKLLGANVNDITGEPAGAMPFVSDVVETAATTGTQVLRLYCTKADGKPAEGPAMLTNKVGAGKVIYMPLNVGKASFLVDYEYVDRMVVEALEWAAREPAPVEVKAPTTVIAAVWRQGQEGRSSSKLIVHLLNDVSSLGRGQVVLEQSVALRREVLPVRGIEVTFRGTGYKRFTLEPGGTVLTARKVPGGLAVTVPEVGLHAMVVAER
jgi:hypothetical protein